MNRLRVLNLNNSRIQDAAGLEDCTDLEELYLGDNDIDSISGFNGQLTRLRRFDIYSNDLDSLAGLEGASKHEYAPGKWK